MHGDKLSFSGPLWHVAYTEPRLETAVQRDVEAKLGFTAYMPREKVFSVIRSRRIEVYRPYFPRYLFVEVDPYRQDWQRLLDIEGVVELLGRPAPDNDRSFPSYVPAPIIEAMRKAESVGMFDLTAQNASGFKIGEEVRVSEGPFSGFNAIIQEFVAKMRSTTARKRAKVLVTFMGRMMKVELSLTEIEKL